MRPPSRPMPDQPVIPNPPAPVQSTDIILGTVPYLNVQPNIWALQNGLVESARPVHIIPEVPSKLAARLADGEFDSAIVPVFEYFRHPQLYSYIPGPVIAATGAVCSVNLVSSQPLEKLHTIYLDASSLTSVHLFKVIAAERGRQFDYRNTATEPPPRPLPPGTGWVVIGDPAIAELGRHAYTMDLALAWRNLTGLPFVFAAWLARRDMNKPGIDNLLAQSLKIGLDNIEQVARESAEPFRVTPEFALRYFRENIHYHLGEKELAGWNRFGHLCFKHGLISEQPELRRHENR